MLSTMERDAVQVECALLVVHQQLSHIMEPAVTHYRHRVRKGDKFASMVKLFIWLLKLIHFFQGFWVS